MKDQKANMSSATQKNLLAGAVAGFTEASICHPFDTVKTRMQLMMTKTNAFGNYNSGNRITALSTARHLIQSEGGPLALYKGLTAVYCGIIPKMALRFSSFEFYRYHLGRVVSVENNPKSSSITFVAGLLSGLTEAVVVVTPAEVCKIRMQTSAALQDSVADMKKYSSINKKKVSKSSSSKSPLSFAHYHSIAVDNSTTAPKYRNVFQTAATVIREEGVGALYKGVAPTMMRQGCNQAVNFTTYQWLKGKWMSLNDTNSLQPWQHLLIGGISGGFGPAVNNPLDVVKTRMQKQVIKAGQPVKYRGVWQSILIITKEEGVLSLWKGLTPRLMRIMPGQAITFMTYEAVSKNISSRSIKV